MTVGSAEASEVFALRSADALAATLDLRCTVACLIDLAASRFGSWAAITLSDGVVLRHVSRAADGRLVERVEPLRDVDPADAALVTTALDAGVRRRPATRPVLEAFAAADPGPSLADGAAVLTAEPLAVPATAGGALVVAGDYPPDEEEFAALARRGANAISAALVYEERTALASTLRAALQPAPLPNIPDVEFAASYRPAQESTQIGGDFYDITPRPDGSWAISIGDVCGKGVEAAVLTGQVRQALRTASLVSDDPVRTLRLVNDALVAHGGDNYVTIVYGLLRRDGDVLRLRLGCGGHPPPFVLRADGVSTVDVRGTIIGMLPEVDFEPADVVLRPGELLLLFTDGATEARNSREMLGAERIAELLADSYDLPAQAVTERVLQLVLDHLDGGSHDDIALLAVRHRPESP